MIIDTSALIAILRNEPDAHIFIEILENASRKFLTGPNYLETCMVAISGRETDTRRDVDDLLTKYDITLIAFPEVAANLAVEAFLKYGKGRGNPAQLNFGDCISYAASKCEAMPLLFKGNDFHHTDVSPALPASGP